MCAIYSANFSGKGSPSVGSRDSDLGEHKKLEDVYRGRIPCIEGDVKCQNNRAEQQKELKNKKNGDEISWLRGQYFNVICNVKVFVTPGCEGLLVIGLHCNEHLFHKKVFA